MPTIHGSLFKNLDLFWSNFRKFFYYHKTLFDVIFLLVYFMEQLILFLLILFYPKYAYIFAGVFAILLISTISFEKICMESRYNFLKENMVNQELQTRTLVFQYNKIYQENQKLKFILKSKLK